ncbi:MAG: alpha amylase C-terminal domain-containing protein [Firmicutes bacterium]|nr:alpha amylase C-terminal domain-containing protein [Bacillota bacterium]
MNNWASEAIFYHIYPLGFCGAPEHNDFISSPVNRLSKIEEWIRHIKELGANAIYLGPVFESTKHGYDTADYFTIDRRLGDNDYFRSLVEKLHQNGIRVILDGVFNHTGRNFWAFRDLQANRQNSSFADWFDGVDFNSNSPYNDSFSYKGWNGHQDLIKLNTNNPQVRSHLLHAVETWIRDFDIDGLRLDVADHLDIGFQQELSAFSKRLKEDFWIMGEVVHGDYTRWANEKTIDSVTNYECYKGLWSSLNDNNYFEIAYALNRQFGKGGIYEKLPLYNFADNHDVNRVAYSLKKKSHLYPLYCLLLTMPGVPSVYYGSEWGISASIHNGDDRWLRPCLDLNKVETTPPEADLSKTISKLSEIRKSNPALTKGSYKQLFVGPGQFAFQRTSEAQTCIVILNSSDEQKNCEIPANLITEGTYTDILNNSEKTELTKNSRNISIYPCWARILRKD